MWRTISSAAGGALAGVVLMSTIGCGTGLFPLINVEVPEAVQYALDNTSDFIAAADDPMETTDPGTLIDDLETLDGCWGTVFTEAEADSQLSLFSVYQFNDVDKTYVSWAFVGRRDTGVLWPLLPLLSEVSGTYAITGDSTIEMTVTRIRHNIDADGVTVRATLQDVSLEDQILTRSALITLDGDQMLFFIDAEIPGDVDEADERPIYFQFDCPD